MQFNKAQELQREAEKSGKECDHKHISKEYHFGTQTGDYVCSDCGAEVGKKLIEERRGYK